jgi:glycosyltransferase involved in cell wall biosynthesis
MDASIFFSIIIPVYNVEKYVERCLDSVFSQEFKGLFEVIVVEDCSTDESLAILNKYSQTHNITIVEHDKNQKLSIARKSGMRIAKGDYIMHLDSDDWLLPGCLNYLYNQCINSNADVIVFNYILKGNDVAIKGLNISNKLETDDKLAVQSFFYGSPWNKIVKRIFTVDMVYGNASLNLTEDLIYSTEILLRVRNICIVPEILYAYFKNSTSLTSHISPEYYLNNQVIVMKELDKLFSLYKSSSEFNENSLFYFEKFIFLQILRLKIFNNQHPKIFEKYFCDQISKSIHIGSDRLNMIKESFNSLQFCSKQVLKHYGMRFTFAFFVSALYYRILKARN